MQVKKLTLQRLLKEEAAIQREPIPNALVTRQGTLNFYFCLYHLEGHYSNGFYFGLLELHQNYPFAAPKLLFYTPSGRFDTNVPICTSFTNYHQESWTSAWNVRTLILAIISFMYSEQPSYGCCQASAKDRLRMAHESLNFNMNITLFVRLFQQKLVRLNLWSREKKQEQNLANYTSYVPQLRLQQHERQKQEKEQLQSDHFEERQQVQKKNKRNKTMMKVIVVLLIFFVIIVLAIKFL